MKDEGLVSVHVGPNNKTRNISGPVAILMQNDTHFLGAYNGNDGKLVLELLPKAFIGSTAWPRNYPYSQQLIEKVEKLDGCALVKDTVRQEIRYFGTSTTSDGRRTSIGSMNPVLEDIRNLAAVTKEKMDQIPN